VSDVLRAMKRDDEALAHQRQALEAFQALSQADPADVAAKNDVAISTFKVGELLQAKGYLAEAIARFESALAIHEGLSAADPHNSEFREQIASDNGALATALAKAGNTSGALAAHARTIALTRTLADNDSANTELRIAVALALIGRAETFVMLERQDEARRDYGEAVAILELLARQGAIEGTDADTLANARAALAKLPE
jgi:tetratricopeptide (TPR) repeat protein